MADENDLAKHIIELLGIPEDEYLLVLRNELVRFQQSPDFPDSELHEFGEALTKATQALERAFIRRRRGEGPHKPPEWLAQVLPIQRKAYEAGLCSFLECWVGVCKKPRAPHSHFCDKHRGRKCWACDNPATSNCDATLGPMVCGVDQCHLHPHSHSHS